MTTKEFPAGIQAQAHIHHALLLGLQLKVATNRTREEVGEWMFRLFRRQHLDKFLSSFEKLGLSDEPDAVACAKYHVLSNNMGGVGVEYMYESDTKAWVRFRYPRWMYHGPTICGVPVEVSRGFLQGWYAHNGVSLGNPNLGFVCVSEDMTGEFGLCGYFKEFDGPLKDNERLQFAKNELPPGFKAEEQPAPPTTQWDELRLLKANRNYVLDYIRNGLVELANVIGEGSCLDLAGDAARLIGLQYYQETAEMISATDDDLDSATHYLATMFEGMGDQVSIQHSDSTIQLEQTGLRVIRGLQNEEAEIVFACWSELWRGAMSAQRQLKTLSVERVENSAKWDIALRR